jgi:hypothetical protein
LLTYSHMPNYLAIVAPDPRLILSVPSLNSLVSPSIFSQPHVSIRGHHLTSPRCLYSRPGSNELLASEVRDLAELRAASVGARPRQAGPARLVMNRPERLPCSCSLLSSPAPVPSPCMGVGGERPRKLRCRGGTFPWLSRTSVLAAPLLLLLNDRCLQARFHPAKRLGSSSWRATRLLLGDVSHSSPSSTKPPPPSQASSTSGHPAPASVPPLKPTCSALSSSSLYARAGAGTSAAALPSAVPLQVCFRMRDATGAG